MENPTPEAPRTTPPIYAEQVVMPVQPPQPSNPLAIWALVFSILGWTFLPLLGSLIGLILGVIAVRREPRGLAIAAIVISVFGGCIAGLILSVIALPLIALAGVAATGTMVMNLDGTGTGQAVEQFRSNNGRLPTSLDEVYGIGNVPTDENGIPLRLRVTVLEFGDQFEIQAIGDDQQWDTADDRTIHSTTTTKITTPSGATVTETSTSTQSGADTDADTDADTGSRESDAGEDDARDTEGR